MIPVTFYGIYCSKKDEKAIAQRVNDYLAKFHRKMSKSKQPILLEKYQPFVIKHFYWNANNSTATWFDIYPNEDLNGNYFFPNHKECSWILHVYVNFHSYPNASTLMAQQFISGLLAAISFKTTIIGQRIVNFAQGPKGDRYYLMNNDGEANGSIPDEVGL